MTGAEKIAAWERIAYNWKQYCKYGPSEFDWDDDSRKVMEELTGIEITYWL